MVFCALHLDRAEDLLAEEEIYLVLPGAGAKTALAVPLDALPGFLPLLERAVGGDSLPACPICGAEIPRLVYDDGNCPSADPG